MVEWRQTYLEDYDVSEYGELRLRVSKNNLMAGHVFKGTNSKGYLRYQLNMNGKRIDLYAHRLVLETFVGKPPTLKHQCMGPYTR